jgi:uncharacterized protein (TIGR02246 family)
MRVFLALMMLMLPITAASADQVADEAAIRDIQVRWDDAWNRHDVDALSALVADDVRFVNVAGVVLKSRADFRALQARTHAMMFKESVRTVHAVEIRFITPEIAVAHVSWGMRGDKNQDGSARQPRNGVMMQVLAKRDGNWIVVAAQNTDIRSQNTNAK